MLATLDAGEAEDAVLARRGSGGVESHGTVTVFDAIVGLALTRTDITVAPQFNERKG